MVRGRSFVSMDRREKLLTGLNVSSGVGLEIGALDKPMLRRSEGEVIYVDYAGAETLRQKYDSDPHVNIKDIVEVDAIWGSNTLQQAIGEERKVDYIVASHVVEHVPDLITWLQELRSVLKPGGQVRLVVPDRRFTFDYLRNETRISDVVNAHLLRARVPQPHSILDFHLNAAKIDCTAAWDGKIVESSVEKFNTFQQSIDAAREVLEKNIYRDVHCWVFTPKSFAALLGELVGFGLIDFACERFWDTEPYTFEFLVALRPSEDKNNIRESWQRMADDAHTRGVEPAAVLKADHQKLDAIHRDLEVSRDDACKLRNDWPQ
jgi:2-polyprenyl-3-methyl-5-hydroxy-6-metoxy-1,4-benzoquinol methylase